MNHLDHLEQVLGEAGERDMLRGSGNARVVGAKPNGEQPHKGDVLLLVLLCEDLTHRKRVSRVERIASECNRTHLADLLEYGQRPFCVVPRESTV